MIKTEIIYKVETTFPKLVISKDKSLIILCFRIHKNHFLGTVVSDTQGTMVGEFAEDWEVSCFDDFEGSITLSNKTD